jgi:ParB family chromosome partitioning protein
MDTFLEQVHHLPIDQLIISETNPRKYLIENHADSRENLELIESIKAKGIIQPIIVRVHPTKKNAYEVIAGARRRVCAEKAGRETVPAIIRDGLTETDVREIQIIENLHRAEVHPLEEAEGFADLLKFAHYDIEKLAAKIGKTAGYIAKSMKLADLIKPIKKAWADGQLQRGHVVQFARLTAEQQKHIWDRLTMYSQDRVPPIAELSKIIGEEFFLVIVNAPWSLDDADLVKKAGACAACPKLSRNSPALFDDVGKQDTCTDSACFTVKLEAFIARAEKQNATIYTRLSERQFVNEKGLYGKEKWKKATKKCEHAHEGIIVDGEELGKVLSVCLVTSGCTTHWSPEARHRDGTGSGETPEAKTKRLTEAKEKKTEIAKRRAVLVEVEKKAPEEITELKHLRVIAGALWNRTYHDLQVKIVKVKGWAEPGQKQRADETVTEKMATMTRPELARFIMFLALSFQMDEAPVDYDYETNERKPGADPLMQFAKEFDVDLKAIEKEFEPKLLKPKASKESKPKQKKGKK